MTVPKVQILKGGILTTVQDLGRVGWQSSGMPVAGAMDKLSIQLANIAVGNIPGAACIEATLAGPEIQFEQQTHFCICGAEMQASINNSPVNNGKAILAHKNDILKMSFTTRGCRSYIAFSGGIDIPIVMGSRSTFIAGKTGGYEGRQLKPGDILALGQPIKKPLETRIPYDLLNNIFSDEPVKILPGPEIGLFGLEALTALLNSTFTIGPDSNRMGYRLEGEKIIAKTATKGIISSPVPMGCLQIPSNGLPVILMADRQTTGGYPRMAIVATVDHPKLAQLKPGDQLCFEEIKLDDAQNLLKEREKKLRAIG